MASSKPTTPGVYTPYSRPQQPRVTLKVASAVSADVLGEPVSSTPSMTTPPAMLIDTASPSRETFLEQFDYVEMRCKFTRNELAKKPYYNEIGVVFHSPAESSVTYDTFFQTTHDFLDVASTLHMFPTFVDLPLNLRPSKVRYDATKQSEDLMLRVRCLFCRGRFGGKNAKAIWERHVKEHWPKQGKFRETLVGKHVPKNFIDRVKEFTREDMMRPMRQIQKRPTGSNAHSRTRSHDSSAWAPNARYNGSSSSPSPSSYSSSSRASSPEPHSPHEYPHAPMCFPSSHSSCSDHDSDMEIAEPTASFFRSPVRSPRKRSTTRPRAHPYPRRPPPSECTDEEDHDQVLLSGQQSFWDVEADLNAIGQASKPCLSRDELQAALEAAMARREEIMSPIKLAFAPSPAVLAAAAAAKRLREDDEAPLMRSPRGHKRQHTECETVSSEESGSGSSGEESSDCNSSSAGSSSEDLTTQLPWMTLSMTRV